MSKLTDNIKENAYVRLHIGILLAGATGVFGRLIQLTEVPLVWYRMIIASLVLWPLLRFTSLGSKTYVQWKGNYVKFILCGATLAIHWVFFYASIKASNVSVAVVCIALDGFSTSIIEAIFERRWPRVQEIALSIFSVVGILLIFGFDPRYRLGILFGLGCTVVYALSSVLCKRVQHETGIKSSDLLLRQLQVGVVLLTLFMPLYLHLNPSASIAVTGNDLMYMPVFATVFTLIPFLFQLQAMRTISAFTVNLSYNMEPVYSILFAMIIFNEGREVGRSFWCGVLLIIVSVVLQTIDSKRRQRLH